MRFRLAIGFWKVTSVGWYDGDACCMSTEVRSSITSGSRGKSVLLSYWLLSHVAYFPARYLCECVRCCWMLQEEMKSRASLIYQIFTFLQRFIYLQWATLDKLFTLSYKQLEFTQEVINRSCNNNEIPRGSLFSFTANKHLSKNSIIQILLQLSLYQTYPMFILFGVKVKYNTIKYWNSPIFLSLFRPSSLIVRHIRRGWRSRRVGRSQNTLTFALSPGIHGRVEMKLVQKLYSLYCFFYKS